jgi:hypothetical protein
MVCGAPNADSDNVDESANPAPAVRCTACGADWRSAAMAEGLRLIGSCPKCGGVLAFAEVAPAREGAQSPMIDERAPHLVLGVPRR